MICITINQESRRFALVDMLNAGGQCDLLEVRLDRFEKAPDLSEIFANKPKPVIMSCRRTQDGGFFDESEQERLAILRQCIISKADYVEIELDVADEIRRFPPSQRVICYTNLAETPPDIPDIYEEAKTKSPDVIKLTTLARTPEGVVVFTHLWWTADGPAEDPYAPDPAVLHASRARVLELADLIVPGHGDPFRPSGATPR